MSIVNRHVLTSPPHNGLSPNVINIPAQWVGYPKASASGAVVTKTQQTAGSSVAVGTQVDYPRNLNVVITPTASSAGVTGGGITVWGLDLFGSTRSETFNSLAATVAAGQNGSINFRQVDTVSMKLSFLAATSSAASAFAVVVGIGQKIGLPVSLASTDAVFEVIQGTSRMSTYSGATSSNNQWTVVTGDYHVNGVSQSAALNSGSHMQIGYKNLGWMAPVGSY